MAVIGEAIARRAVADWFDRGRMHAAALLNDAALRALDDCAPALTDASLVTAWSDADSFAAPHIDGAMYAAVKPRIQILLTQSARGLVEIDARLEAAAEHLLDVDWRVHPDVADVAPSKIAAASGPDKTTAGWYGLFTNVQHYAGKAVDRVGTEVCRRVGAGRWIVEAAHRRLASQWLGEAPADSMGARIDARFIVVADKAREALAR